jgi:RNA polymerase sigma-70 factor (ECF subfamily)
VGYNECLMRLRGVRPDVELDAVDEPETVMPANFTDWSSVPEAVISSDEAADELARAIARLKPEYRAVFMLRDVDELSTAETAQALGISETLVKVRLHRARLMLREWLAAYFDNRARV